MSPREQDWHEIVVGDLIAFASPVPLQPTTAVGTDTAFSEWQGEGITVRVDYGLFVDRLESSQRQDGAEAADETIDGVPARRVSYTRADGTRFTALHFPDLAAGDNRRRHLSRRWSGYQHSRRVSLERATRLSQPAGLGRHPRRTWLDAGARGLPGPCLPIRGSRSRTVWSFPPVNGLAARDGETPSTSVPNLERC